MGSLAMAGYQFVHFEAYAKVSKKGSGGSGHATEGRTADEVIAEAAREAGNHPHVRNPKPARVVDACRDGYNFDDLKADYEAACNSQVTMKNGKTRKNRSTALTLATIVCSYPVPCDEIKTPEQKADYLRWEKRSLDYARAEFGDNYRMAVRHTDEKFPHLHIFAVAPDARRLHPGLAAAKTAENCGKKGGDLGKAAADGLRAAQDRYYESVGQYAGQARLGPRRTRLSRKDWVKTQFANQKTAEMLNNPGKLRAEAEAQAAAEWGKKSLVAKVAKYGNKSAENRQFVAGRESQSRAEKAALSAVARADASAAKERARADSAERQCESLKGAMDMERAKASEATHSAGVLDALLQDAIPYLPAEQRQYVRDVLQAQASNTVSAGVAAACAPAAAEVADGDDEVTRNLKIAAARDTARNNSGPSM